MYVRVSCSCVCVCISAGAASQDAQMRDTQTGVHARILLTYICLQAIFIYRFKRICFFVHVLTGANTVTDKCKTVFVVRPPPVMEKCLYSGIQKKTMNLYKKSFILSIYMVIWIWISIWIWIW